MDNTDYPRPQFTREAWQTLDGTWSYAFDDTGDAERVGWQGDIQVPYPPESSLSGVGDTAYHPVVWYRRSFTVPPTWRDHRVILHFGAVDYRAQVWVNGQLVASHEGGHTPFSADISEVLTSGDQTVTIRAEDDPTDLTKPRGKQDWQPEPHGIWYPRTTGIWQPVWLEVVQERHIAALRFTPDLAAFAIDTEVEVAGSLEGASLEWVFRLDGEVVAADRCQVLTRRTRRRVGLPRDGFDDLKHFAWSPEHPNLIEVEVTLHHGDTVLDRVGSYTGLRSVEARDGRFLLNGRPYFLRLALDQGYWDESLLAAPSGDALRRDVELAKAMGFNGVRKHQKIEDPRYLYWADRLGLVVWEEMPSAYQFSDEVVRRLTREWLEVLERDHNHPCIVAWVCFNESWGVPTLVHNAAERNFVAGLYHLTKAHDGSRLVVGNDGWEHIDTDLLTIHDYAREPEVLGERYGTPEATERTARTGLLGHGRPTLVSFEPDGEPAILSEFGGIRFNPESEEGWGYQQVDSAEALVALYRAMILAISGSGLAGFCYTQFADTFQEQNGLLYSDRRPKAELSTLYDATRGGR